mgnify:CR=1 FL=1
MLTSFELDCPTTPSTSRDGAKLDEQIARCLVANLEGAIQLPTGSSKEVQTVLCKVVLLLLTSRVGLTLADIGPIDQSEHGNG